jgi:ParB-like chromosome segregation protein Spo0J
MISTLDRSDRRKQRLDIVYRPIDEIRPDPANPRLHSKNQIRKLANSIKTFGFNVPILIDSSEI